MRASSSRAKPRARVFAGSANVAYLRVADGFRIGAYIILAVSLGAVVRPRNTENGRASVLDGAIVGCALFATCWPMLAYPSALSRTAEVSGGPLGVTRTFFAIVLCAMAVRLLFRPEAAARLLFFGLVPLAAADLFAGAGIEPSNTTGRGVLELTALFALSMIVIAASRPIANAHEPVVEIDPANRIRVLCILTSVALCSVTPLADAWSTGHRDVATLMPGICAIVVFVLIAMRLWHLATSAASCRYAARSAAARCARTGSQ